MLSVLKALFIPQFCTTTMLGYARIHLHLEAKWVQRLMVALDRNDKDLAADGHKFTVSLPKD